MHPPLNPPAPFGSGEIVHRYGPTPLSPLPWYYNQTKTSAAALVAIGLILLLIFKGTT
jgi:hypothetical protein